METEGSSFIDGAGASYDPPAFAFRGKKAGVEFRKKHRKYVSALNRSQLPEYGDEGQAAREVYEQFLHGLELINQQEALQLGRKNADLKSWERQIRTRANVHTQRQFDENLRRRVKRPMSDRPSDCAMNQCPIREATRAYLTRPVETDFSVIGALVYLGTCCLYVFTLAAQINQIRAVCSSGYACPASSVTAGFPIVAPPVAWRNLTSAPIQLDGSTPVIRLANLSWSTAEAFWEPSVHATCPFGSKNCDAPGYEVQWPYMQGATEDGPPACDGFATTDVCTGDGGENCDRGRTAQCAIPFEYDGIVFTGCTKVDSSNRKPWCMINGGGENADEDEELWGHCNACKGEQVTIPPELMSKCRIVAKGAAGWVWDPFLGDVRHEYLDCSADGSMPRKIPLLQKVVIQGQISESPLHFDTAFYSDLHKNTLECMEEALAGVKNEDGSQVIDSLDLWHTLGYEDDALARLLLGNCMSKRYSASLHPSTCAFICGVSF